MHGLVVFSDARGRISALPCTYSRQISITKLHNMDLESGRSVTTSTRRRQPRPLQIWGTMSCVCSASAGHLCPLLWFQVIRQDCMQTCQVYIHWRCVQTLMSQSSFRVSLDSFFSLVWASLFWTMVTNLANLIWFGRTFFSKVYPLCQVNPGTRD